MQHPRNERGFTLIELMIVVVILGILAAIAVPKFSGASQQAKQSEASAILKQMYTMQSAHYERYGEYTPDAGEAGLGRVGWDAPDARYYEFSIASASGDAFCVAANPKEGENVEPRSMKGNRAESATDDRALFESADCSGTRLDQ